MRVKNNLRGPRRSTYDDICPGHWPTYMKTYVRTLADIYDDIWQCPDIYVDICQDTVLTYMSTYVRTVSWHICRRQYARALRMFDTITSYLPGFLDIFRHFLPTYVDKCRKQSGCVFFFLTMTYVDIILSTLSVDIYAYGLPVLTVMVSRTSTKHSQGTGPWRREFSVIKASV